MPGVAPLGEDGLETRSYIIDASGYAWRTHTAKFKPWELVWYCAFPHKYKALEFEKYLKSHSGRAFAKKRL